MSEVVSSFTHADPDWDFNLHTRDHGVIGGWSRTSYDQGGYPIWTLRLWDQCTQFKYAPSPSTEIH